MARIRERVFMGVVACLFLLTSLGGTGFIIWQMVQDNKAAKQQSQVDNAAQTATASQHKLEGKSMDGFTPMDKIGDLQTTDTTVGTGDEAKAGDTVTVDYTGAVAATGVVFQSSLDSGQPVSLSLNQVIDGWKEGIPGMKVGGTRRLLIPAAKAYGATPPQGSGIPANADLVFDVTLRKIGQ